MRQKTGALHRLFQNNYRLLHYRLGGVITVEDGQARILLLSSSPHHLTSPIWMLAAITRPLPSLQVCSDSGRLVSFGALKDAAFRWGGYLLTKGLERGSVVAVLSPNMVDYPAVMLGTFSVGCVYTGINPSYTPTEVAYQLKDSGAKMLVVFGPLLEVAKKAMAINKQDLPMVAIGSSDGLPNVADIVQDTTINFAPPAKLTGEECMALLYSSGTTGKPKGVSVHHTAGIANLDMISHPSYFLGGLSTADSPSFALALPMFHLSGFLAITSLAVLNGVKLVNVTKFNPGTFIDILLENRVSHRSTNRELLKKVYSIQAKST
ncbi:4-coumarate--CoA ligase-like 7 [Hyalella azteca]|uniref:4-coumarate--CoA ligase-like 7 n=1 Tax=Hyalella azteca TaxID=294128 RepID=A0A8B7NEH7_HYAAZ|nr:4-coumarate--CoA ligase-like 7 [Hyalella azteca]